MNPKIVSLVLILVIACGAFILSNEIEPRTPKSKQMKSIISDHPNYNSLKQFKNDNAKELMSEFGAHSLGIRWRENLADAESNNKDIVLAVYIDTDIPSGYSVPEYVEIEELGTSEILKIAVEVIPSKQHSFE